MTVSDAEFKAVLGRFPTGVTVVTSCDGERPVGVTVNAFASVSLDPPLALVCIDRRSHLHDVVVRAGYFAANILGAEQAEESRRFAGQSGDRNERFRQTPFHSGTTGAPILDAAIAHVECRVVAVYPGGDHSIFLGEVVALGASAGEPLIYYRARYGSLHPLDGGAGDINGVTLGATLDTTLDTALDAGIDTGVAPGQRE